MFLKINGRLHYLWRAVDQDGEVLDILVQHHRDRKAAKKFFRKLLKGGRYVPRVVIYRQAEELWCRAAETLPSVVHCQDKGRNNRSENSHQPEIAGACDEPVQISWPRAALSLGLRHHFIALPSGQTFVPSRWLLQSDENEIRLMERCHLREANR